MNNLNNNISVDFINFVEEFNSFVVDFLNANYISNSDFLDAVSYSLLNGGKRIRPFFIYYIGSILNIEKKCLFQIGLAIEMIHTYTLVHDDLPAMDNDDFRRGKLSSHKKYSEGIAILVGDALLSDSFFILSNPNLLLQDSIKLKLINEISLIIGSSNLILGQYLDINFSNLKLNKTKDIIFDINLLKTAKLFALCAKIPAVIVNNPMSNNLFLWGETFGFLYQMQDDKTDKQDNKTNILNTIGSKNFNNMCLTKHKQLFDLSVLINQTLKIDLTSLVNFFIKGDISCINT